MQGVAVSRSEDVLAWLRSHPAMRPVKRSRSFLPTGFAQLDLLLDRGGLPRGGVTELCSRTTAGRTALCLFIAAKATHRGELVAWVDPADALDPRTLAACGMQLERFLWIRPSRQKACLQALRATDLILEAGGFAMLTLDLAGVRARAMASRPAWWVRLGRRLEKSQTALVALAPTEVAGGTTHLRMSCRYRKGYIELCVTKKRGGVPGAKVELRLDDPVD